jgi:ABC-2 type transport system permease protein
MTQDRSLYALDEAEGRSGLRNMLRHENDEWWGTRRWWMGILIWTALVNGLIFMIVRTMPTIEGEIPLSEMDLFFISGPVFINFLGFFGALGVIVYAQGAIVGEKESGTAAWILSKPVSRFSFVLSKLLANFAGVLVIIVVLQSAIYLAQIILSGGAVDLIRFLNAVGLVTLSLIFYLSLVIVLGTFFNSRRPVLGISLGILIGQLILSNIIFLWWPWFEWLEPYTLVTLAERLVQGDIMPEQWPITVITVSLLSVLSITLAVWRFGREEF